MRHSAAIILLALLLTGCVVLTPDFLKGSDYDRARLLYESGYLFQARELAKKVDRQDPSYEAAKRLLRDIRRIQLDIARAHMEMGEGYERAGIIPKAEDEYKKSLKYNPDNLLVRKRLAMLAEGATMFSEGTTTPPLPERKPEASKTVPPRKRLVKNKPDPEELANEHYMKGKLYLESKAYGKAIVEFTSVLDILPTFMDTEKLLKQARLERDDTVDFHFKRGINFFQKEEIAMAIMEWNIVLELDPENREAAEYKQRAMVIMERLQKIKERHADK